MIIFNNINDLTFKKLASSWLATARANNVFPVPGGP